MSSLPIKKYSLSEYFELEKTSDVRYEYVFGEIFLMSGGSPNHNRIAGAIYANLYPQLINTPCESFTENMRTRTHNQVYRYPDIVVACTPRFININGVQSLTNPILIVEVLSESTEAYDMDRKFQEYRQIESLIYYLLVSQIEVLATLFTKDDNGNWTNQVYTSLDEILEFPAINCKLSIRDIYLRVQFNQAS